MFRHTARFGALLLMSATTLVFGCDTDTLVPEEAEFEGVEKLAMPASVTLEVGQVVWLTVAPRNEEGTKRQISWSSSDPNVARVSDRGRVQALAEGSATIIADCGAYCVSAAVTVISANDD